MNVWPLMSIHVDSANRQLDPGIPALKLSNTRCLFLAIVDWRGTDQSRQRQFKQ